MRHHGALAGLAAVQHGVVSSAQLIDLGYSPAALTRAIEAGRLHPIHRGVYAVGHRAVTEHGRALAAVLTSGVGAILSHTSAAWLWGILARVPRLHAVTTPARGHRRIGIETHHSTILEPEDQAVVSAIPATAVPRTLLDLAATNTEWTLKSAVESADRLAVLDLAAVDALLGRCGRHRGRRRLADSLGIYREPGFFRARSERLLIKLIEDAGLPRPSVNLFVEGHELDAYWPEELFAVEVDGWASHGSRDAFERDRLRDEDLKLAGIEIVRFTARRIEREPRSVGRRLKRLLANRRRQLGLPT